MATPADLPPLPSNPDENAGPHILGATLSTTCLAFVTVLARFYVRGFVVKNMGFDDYFMALAMSVSIATTTVIALSVKYGAGQHIGDVEPDIFIKGMKLNFISQPLLQAGVCIVKLSVGCALLRIATKKRWRFPIIGIMIFMVCYTIGTMTTLFTQCEQVAMQWDGSIPRKCWDQETLQGLAFTHAALNIATDFVFAVVIPVPILWGLQMNKRTKGAVMLMLSLGLFVCLAGILRIPTIENYGKTGDFLWDSRDLCIWFVAEFNTGIIAGSFPSLKPLFKTILDNTYFKGLTAKYGYGNNTGPTGSKHRSFSSKGFNNLRATERLDSHDQVDDSDGSLSQRGLVLENKPIALGVIQKNVTTTVTQTDVPITPKGARRHEWA
ncbi:uncharacterized protein HMPREF1541_07328 [Cyphellophora europaea CBS 101466]|uniref:Rhodopsin domain-containing protein n=1 Tax=Cyphellophora europaea (strain CBS 101466) TaxID=1220924 RepID=W2RMZ6_CYPE1|nr:uncharacterized protein HMPREF1541_07328 [Cyphellophora europaea CBS 101466]ETN37705.1 hypothetical protein HMPREF1541_07328 [Cyphellophora europaea CBS 101466]